MKKIAKEVLFVIIISLLLSVVYAVVSPDGMTILQKAIKKLTT